MEEVTGLQEEDAVTEGHRAQAQIGATHNSSTKTKLKHHIYQVASANQASDNDRGGSFGCSLLITFVFCVHVIPQLVVL